MLDLRGDIFISVEDNGSHMRFYAHKRHASFEKTKQNVTPQMEPSNEVKSEILALTGYDEPKSKELQAFLDTCHQNFEQASH